MALVLDSLRGYQRAWLARDVVAGCVLAAVAIPEVMGYTSISQTPLQTGLYTVIFPTIVFALFASSRLLVVGADSATAAVLAAGLGGLTRRRAHPRVRPVGRVREPDRTGVRRAAAAGADPQARLHR